MDQLQKYNENIQEGQSFLDNHNALLQSLILSKQNASTNDYTEGTNGVPDGTQQPG